MKRTFLVAAMVLASFAAHAQSPTVDSFSVKTLGEAASKISNLGEPITMEVEVALTGPVQDIEPLVTYLRAHSFEVEGHMPQPASGGSPAKPLVLVGRKTAVLSREEIDRYESEIRPLVPKGLTLNWRFAQTKIDS